MEYIYRNIENIPVDIEYPDDFENIVTESLDKPIIYNRFKRVAHCPRFGETFDYIETIRKGDWLPYKIEHSCHTHAIRWAVAKHTYGCSIGMKQSTS